ncbi:proline dehydrogenase family protein [Halocola ammonii]
MITEATTPEFPHNPSVFTSEVDFDNTEVAFQSKSDLKLRKAYWLFKMVGRTSLVKLGKGMTFLALKLRIPIAWIIRPTIFQQFCGGESIERCAKTTKILDAYNIGTILDYSVEGKETEEDFERTTKEVIKTIQTAEGNPHIPFCVFKVTGVARFDLLHKINEDEKLTEDEKAEFKKVHERIERICQTAHEARTPVFIDAEESWIQDTIDSIAEEMMAKYNDENAIIYNTIQLYRHDKLDYLTRLLDMAKEKNFRLGVKLVRGAYMEKERKRADDMGYPSPIQPDKESCDRDFDSAMVFCMEHLDDISFCAGTHNEESCMYLVQMMKQFNIEGPDPRVFFAQLFGMSDHISFNLSNAGYNVAKYVPYGPIREVIPYLIRRAEENTSVKGQTGRELGLIMKELNRRRSMAGNRVNKVRSKPQSA